MTDRIRTALMSQYDAALSMLQQTIERCPEEVWYGAKGNLPPFWKIAYHVLFYTDLYLAPTESDYRAWSKAQRDAHVFGTTLPYPPFEPVRPSDPYSRADLLEYIERCRQTAVDTIADVDLEAASGFDWLPFSKLEHLLYNLRHLQHHTGELSGRMLAESGVEIDWIGMGSRAEED